MKVFISIVFALFSFSLLANNSAQIFSSYEYQILVSAKSPNKFFLKLRKKAKKAEKTTAAILAFPVPFGIIGLHRIYLGTKPYVPVVYIITVGGCLGVLPLVDFIAILRSDDLSKFQNIEKIFMWVK
jgi:TM2 domain-containing membrane protein YozV